MVAGNVGARILSIITESLYDKPIVVFREYVQNSVDSFGKIQNITDPSELIANITFNEGNLVFVDNGQGIPRQTFHDQMRNIADSKKNRISNIGYKGIGRLSGLPYCMKITFINICSYRNESYQSYVIDGDEYNNIKNNADIDDLSFSQLMEKIGKFTDNVVSDEQDKIRTLLSQFDAMFRNRDTGFIVILNSTNKILETTIKRDNFINELGWLLPVKFQNELLEDKDKKELFLDMMQADSKTSIIPAQSFNVMYNGLKIERPIKKDMLRDFLCKTNYINYAVGFHTFNHDKIQVTSNEFSGIKLYIDNVLLCDENELIPVLLQYGLINRSSNELIQTVRGIGAIIYIIDKVSISANARRTFIEITDNDSLDFLKSIASFINSIYIARYALSRYSVAKNAFGQERDKINKLKDDANSALKELAKEEIDVFDTDQPKQFEDLDNTEQKKVVKRVISHYVNQKLKDYLAQTTSFDYNNAIEDFKIWFQTNK